MITSQESAPGFPSPPKGLEIHPLADGTIIVVGWILMGLLWMLHVRKLRGEIEKLEAERELLKADAIKSAGDTLKNLQAARDSHKDACDATTIHARTVAAIFQGDGQGLAAAHDALCKSIGSKQIHCFHAYCEWAQLKHKHEPNEWRDFILKVVCPELDDIAQMVETCNHPRLLQRLGTNPYKVSPQSVQLYLGLSGTLSDKDKSQVQPLVSRAVERVLRA